MRKRLLLVFAALGLLLLSGCRRELTDKPMTVRLGEDMEAVFTGVTEDGTAEGVLEFSDWTYEGTFREDGLIAGRADNYPWTLVIAGEEMPGRYTGALDGASPVGEGVFRSGNGMVYVGETVGIAAVAGEISDLPYTLARDGSRYQGLYTGSLENGVPAGTGSFSGANTADQVYVWEGSWTAGEPAGDGVLRCGRLLIPVENRERLGTYEGAGRDGRPEGEGVFRSVDDIGVSFTYEGAWHEGRMEGEGTLRYDAANRFVRRGNFTAGSFTPTWIQALQTYGTCEPLFTLTEAQLAFLEEHPELWEEEDHLNFLDSRYKQDYDKSLTVAACFEDPTVMDEPRWMCQYALRVISVQSGPLFDGGPTMTRITATENSYSLTIRVLVPGTVNGLYRGQRVHAYAVPLGISSYTTVLGVEKPILLLLAGDLYNGS